MRIVLESTSEIVTVNGAPARLWRGRTARGVPIVAFVTSIAVQGDADASDLEELGETDAPHPMPEAALRAAFAQQPKPREKKT